jgi:hypothetical protein
MKANTVNGRELLQAVMSEHDKIYYIMIQNYISIANRIQSRFSSQKCQHTKNNFPGIFNSTAKLINSKHCVTLFLNKLLPFKKL